MSFWSGTSRPTRPALTPYTNEQLKAAFFALLEDYQNKINDECDYDVDKSYCCRCCPLSKRDGWGYSCPAQIPDDDDDYNVDENICHEEILKWYARNDND